MSRLEEFLEGIKKPCPEAYACHNAQNDQKYNGLDDGFDLSVFHNERSFPKIEVQG